VEAFVAVATSSKWRCHSLGAHPVRGAIFSFSLLAAPQRQEAALQLAFAASRATQPAQDRLHERPAPTSSQVSSSQEAGQHKTTAIKISQRERAKQSPNKTSIHDEKSCLELRVR